MIFCKMLISHFNFPPDLIKFNPFTIYNNKKGKNGTDFTEKFLVFEKIFKNIQLVRFQKVGGDSPLISL